MPAAPQHPIGPHTVEEWLTLPAAEDGSRAELLYGYLHASPHPVGKHQRVLGRLCRLKMAAYASAGVPFAWAIDHRGELELTAYRLVEGEYPAQDVVRQGSRATTQAAPLPIPDLNSLVGW
ncbi:hypothetical protein [Saccharothrix xinjiangensis]|uniref:Restriction endonuclease n=1 Tax=Saccharothrix xinjiangensis TaxID=204798 RepID=A0ABV9Y7M9_9PSEU